MVVLNRTDADRRRIIIHRPDQIAIKRWPSPCRIFVRNHIPCTWKMTSSR